MQSPKMNTNKINVNQYKHKYQFEYTI